MSLACCQTLLNLGIAWLLLLLLLLLSFSLLLLLGPGMVVEPRGIIVVVVMISQVNLGQTCLSDSSNVDLKIIYKQQIIIKI